MAFQQNGRRYLRQPGGRMDVNFIEESGRVHLSTVTGVRKFDFNANSRPSNQDRLPVQLMWFNVPFTSVLEKNIFLEAITSPNWMIC